MRQNGLNKKLKAYRCIDVPSYVFNSTIQEYLYCKGIQGSLTILCIFSLAKLFTHAKLATAQEITEGRKCVLCSRTFTKNHWPYTDKQNNRHESPQITVRVCLHASIVLTRTCVKLSTNTQMQSRYRERQGVFPRNTRTPTGTIHAPFGTVIPAKARKRLLNLHTSVWIVL